MEQEAAQLVIHLDTQRPIDVDIFVAEFIGLKNQYEKFLRREHPDLASEAKFYVKEILPDRLKSSLSAMMNAIAQADLEAEVTLASDEIDRVGRAL